MSRKQHNPLPCNKMTDFATYLIVRPKKKADPAVLHQSTGSQMVRFKTRLKYLVLNTPNPGGSVEGFMDVWRNTGGEKSAPNTIKSWIKNPGGPVPNASDLYIIGQIRTDIRIDWLIGLKPPELPMEHVIEAYVSNLFGVVR